MLKTLFGGLLFAICFFAVVGVLLFGAKKMRSQPLEFSSCDKSAESTTSQEFSFTKDVEKCNSLGGVARMGMCFINSKMEYVYD